MVSSTSAHNVVRRAHGGDFMEIDDEALNPSNWPTDWPSYDWPTFPPIRFPGFKPATFPPIPDIEIPTPFPSTEVS